jgi:hypothetical protein
MKTVERYREWLADEPLLYRQAVSQLSQTKRNEKAASSEDGAAQIDSWIGGSLPPIHIYRVNFDYTDFEVTEENYSETEWKEIKATVRAIRQKYKQALKDGFIDTRTPLDPTRRAYFEREVANFDPDCYPEMIPDVFTEGACTIFGHICPVFFAAEAISETESSRRIGRRELSFETMMRIVRRDDYRCQHCKKKLQDDEVEFDHIIPISKGGSSEEHNLRLTCFDCNRDKSDRYIP